MSSTVEYIISDLHMCDKGPRDTFCLDGRLDRFNKFLDWVQTKENYKITVLGDMLDFWRVNISGSINAYKDILDRLYFMHAVYVPGNHDNAFVNFLNTKTHLSHMLLEDARPPYSKIIGGKEFTFLHGHEVDKYCKDNNPGIGNINVTISGLLADKNHSPIKDGKNIEDELINALQFFNTLYLKIMHHPNSRTQTINDIEDYRKSKNADVVIYGHTHEAGNIGTHHYNTGTWSRDVDTFAEITDDGTVNLYVWTKDNKAIPFQHSLI